MADINTELDNIKIMIDTVKRDAGAGYRDSARDMLAKAAKKINELVGKF